jgi:hypothetical protein
VLAGPQEADWQAECGAAVRAAVGAREAACLAKHTEWRLADARAAEARLAAALDERKQT